MKIEIIDGVEIDISGPLRKLDTVDSEEEAELLIQHLTTQEVEQK
jgi:hypothetical protein